MGQQQTANSKPQRIIITTHTGRSIRATAISLTTKTRITMTHQQNLNKAERLLYISSNHLVFIRSHERTQHVQRWIMLHIKRHEAIVRHYNECKFQSGMLNSLTRSYFGAPQLNDNN